MAVVTICSDFGAPQNSLLLFPLFPHLFAMKWWDWMSCSWMLSFKPDSSLPSFIFIKRLFSSSLLSVSIFGLCLKLTVSQSASLDVLERGFPGDSIVKNLPAKAGDTGDGMWVWPLGWEDPLEKEMATHSSILAWRIPWTEEPDGLQSMGSETVGHDWAHNKTHMSWRSLDHTS